MKVFLYEDNNPLEALFLRPEYEIPFLGSNLFDFAKQAFERLAESLNEELYIYVPSSWDLDQKKYDYNILSFLDDTEPELIFLTSLYSIFFTTLDKEYIQHIKQNQGKAFSNSGTVCSYLTSEDGLNEPEDDPTLSSFIKIDNTNFLKVNQRLIASALSSSPLELDSSNTIYGNPIVLSEDVHSSTICGPCFIEQGAFIDNSYISPGSVIRKDSSIVNSKVFSSFIDSSRVENSELNSSLTINSFLNQLYLKNSVLPNGSVIINERQV